MRARKKRQTENAIEQSAVRLALQRGHAAVTVRDICESADISRATFFNYMPTREAAIFGRPVELVGEEAARAVLAARSVVDPVIAVLHLLLASIGHARMNPAVAQGRARLALEQPGAIESIRHQYAAITLQLTTFLAGWLRENPAVRRLPERSPEDEASLAVGVGMTAMSALFAAQDGETTDVELSEELFRAQVDAVRRVAGG